MKNLNDTLDLQNESLELQEMREQLTLLNQKLEKEHILNENLMRKSMHKRFNKYHRQNWYAVLVILLIVYPSLYLLYRIADLSLALLVVSVLYLFLAIAYSFYTWHPLRREDFLADNLCEVSTKLATIKKNYNKWMTFAIPFALMLFIWFAYELGNNNSHFSVDALRGLIIGGIAGGIAGTFKNIKMRKEIKETLKDIEELTQE